MKMSKANKAYLAAHTRALVSYCFRNTHLEDLHMGTYPSSKMGDYSDVKVVSPYGEIPWNKLSRISDEEMKKLIKECVNKVYTVMAIPFMNKKEKERIQDILGWAEMYTRHWDTPEIVGASTKNASN